ncbi:MAG TPA: sigma 54-interacting transcriptional regulator [Chthoniobacterales bacterium]
MISRSERPVETLGASEVFLRFQQQVARVAGAFRPVILIGERGTGKELAAARIHYLSPRWSGPFIKLNCAALAASVLESELFGHEAGAFTGANRRREGRFESADGGTLFLDELGLMPLTVQEKLLRVVEYGVFERVGSSETIEVNVRLVAATSVDLRLLVNAGRFKADLLDRLSFQVLHLPPLRLRDGDIPLLADHFARRFAVELGLEWAPVFAPSALGELQRYDWPGNIRELRNAVERAVYLSEGPEISAITLDPLCPPFELRHTVDTRPASKTDRGERPSSGDQFPLDFDEVIADREIELIRGALGAARYHQQSAAKLLGLSYDRFRGLYRKYKRAWDQGPAREP